MTTKILLLGNTGQVGWELNRTLLPLGGLVTLDYPLINMADPSNIRLVLAETKPDIIINATAYTRVDRAEKEPEIALAINANGVEVLAQEARKYRAAVIHYSTDYVFDGTKGSAYSEDDQPTPMSVYGKTKLAGDIALQLTEIPYLIFRTSWVYSLRRPSFVTKVLDWARQHQTLRIVDDQISNPTWARSLAEATAQVLAQGKTDVIGFIQEKCGLYNLTDSGTCSRYSWAQAILALDPEKHEQVVTEILPAKSIDFVVAAQRPLVSTLNCEKVKAEFSLSLPAWDSVLALAINQ